MTLVCYMKWRGMPFHANHGLLTFLICATVFAVIIKHYLFPKAARESLEWRRALYEEMAALVRVELLTLYFYVVLHKLNWDYLNPDFSCGAVLYQQIAEHLTFLPTYHWVLYPTLLGALTLEMTIPMLLIARPTRTYGVLIGMAFHLILSLHPNGFIYDFSAMLYALYFLFLPDSVYRNMAGAFRRLAVKFNISRLKAWLTAGVLGVAAFITFAVVAQLMYGKVSRKTLIDALHRMAPTLMHGTWFVAAFFAVSLMLICIRRKRSMPVDEPASASDKPFFQMIRPAFATPLVLIVLIVMFNGLCPYLGLKTESSFAMYSNLRTEQNSTNHLFMPVRFRVAHYQEDIVEIVESNDRSLANTALARQGMVAMEFQRYLSKRRNLPKDFFVTYKRSGTQHTLTLADKGKDPLFKPVSWIEGRLLHFRTVQLWDGPQLCGH